MFEPLDGGEARREWIEFHPIGVPRGVRRPLEEFDAEVEVHLGREEMAGSTSFPIRLLSASVGNRP